MNKETDRDLLSHLSDAQQTKLRELVSDDSIAHQLPSLVYTEVLSDLEPPKGVERTYRNNRLHTYAGYLAPLYARAAIEAVSTLFPGDSK